MSSRNVKTVCPYCGVGCGMVLHVEDGQVVAAPMMYIALSYDHRIIDGKDAVLFLVDIKNQLENPHRMLVGI
mgnify:CR=1 FL=1